MKFLIRTTCSLPMIYILLAPSISDASCLPPPSNNLQRRQTNFADLALPKCALPCYINGLTSDGCANETDFECHCREGTVISASDSCMGSRCNKEDKAEAIEKIRKACRAAGVDIGKGSGEDDSRSTETQARPVPTTPTTTSRSSSNAVSLTSSTMNSPPSPPPSSSSTSSPGDPANGPAPGPSPSPSDNDPSRSGSSNGPTNTDPPPMPTDTPLALLPSDRQLSAAAKAGIGVSVSILFTSILIAIALYIRRLKRELRAAQAQAAGVPESVWRAHISTAAAPGPISRRRSWRDRSRGRSPPMSPVSPLRETTEVGPGLLKKKRGHVLSVVVEREEEGSESASLERMVREPVPGQMEGLVDPLELDGQYTGIVELPTSITPRARSLERMGRERGSSFGESSRPSTRGSGERGRYVV